MTYLVNQFPDNLEVLVQQSGHQNEFIKELAIFQSAVEFIKKEYDGKAQDCLKGEDVKMSTFMKFLDYLDTPLEEGTYKYAQMGKICNRFQQENEEIMPLTIQPIYILNRQKGNAKKIEEMEDMILKTDTIKEQYDIILQDIKENEEKAKEQLGDRYIEPDENFLKEKAIAILYFQALQTHMAQECKIEDDSSAVNVLTKYSLYRPRENGRIESNIESIAKFLKLLPKESQNDLLALFNKDSIEDLEKLKNDKNFLDKIDAII